jgi:DNA-binding transcriptional MerR regulator
MTNQKHSLTIGALAKACGVSSPTIRYYEKIELMPKAERSRSDQRRYGPTDVQRLSFIRRCREFGFSTKQVTSLLAVPSGSSNDCQASRDIALSRINDIRIKVMNLLALEKELQTLIDACQTTCGDKSDRTCGAFLEMQTANPKSQ